MTDNHKRHATGSTQVKSYVAATFDEVAGAAALIEVRLTETFTGDISGEGIGRAIQAAHEDGAATFVGIERVRGSIGECDGTFLLQISGAVLHKEMRAEWFVIPGSGTGNLTGLRGDGGFKAQLGHHGSVWLDYSFE
jgi:hypothetical protein